MHLLKIPSVLICFFLGFLLQINAQVLPTHRFYDWTMAGNSSSFFTLDTIDFQDFRTHFDNDDLAIEAAIEELEDGGLIYFPSDDYFFTETIELNDYIQLKGDGPALTHLEFDLGGEGHLISMQGDLSNQEFPLVEPAFRGEKKLLISANETIQPGDFLKISYDDSDLITSNWASNTVGQIVSVVEVEEDTIYLLDELRLDLPLNRTPVIQKIHPKRGNRIACLSINRQDSTASQTSHIHMRYAFSSSVENIESAQANFAHVSLIEAAYISVKNCYFHHAHGYGGGGRAYGVALSNTTSACHITHSVFEHLRHSLLLQSGSNGNVLAYNYSFSPYWEGVNLPADAAGDLVLHGNYPFANLLEGNVVQNIVVDASHGKNGPHNTFLRNRAEKYGIVMSFGPASDSCNFIGNEISNPSDSLGFYFLNGEGHFTYGNYVKGALMPKASDGVVESSLFTMDTPTGFTSQDVFPPIPSYIMEGETIPAMRLFETESLWSNCGIANGLELSEEISYVIQVYPNPAQHIIHVHIENTNSNQYQIQLFNVFGVKVYSSASFNKEIDIPVHHLSRGYYQLLIQNEAGQMSTQSVILL